MPGIAGENPDVVRQIVIQAKIGSLCIDQRKAVADDGVAAECLLVSKDGLNAADRAFITAKRLQAVVNLKPSTLGMMTAREFGAQAQPSVPGLPPRISAVEILMCSLQQTIVGEPKFKSLFRQVEAGAAACSTMSARTPRRFCESNRNRRS